MNFSNIWNRNKPGQIMQLYGVLTAIGLIIYFLIMYAIGLGHITELRYLNFFIMLPGVYFAIRHFRRTHDGHLNYFRTLALGTAAGTIATVIFAVFMLLFLQFNDGLMKSIQATELLGRYLNPYMASFLIILEGIISAFSLAYLFGNVMQTDSATEPQGGEIPTVDWGDSRETRHGARFQVRESHG